MEEIFRSQFRLPYELYERLKSSADESRRSLNAEVVHRLEEGFSKKLALEDASDAEILQEIVRRMGGKVEISLRSIDDEVDKK